MVYDDIHHDQGPSVVGMISVGRLPGERHWELNQDNSLLSLLYYIYLSSSSLSLLTIMVLGLFWAEDLSWNTNYFWLQID